MKYKEKIIGIISTKIDGQNQKGLKKYGIPIEEAKEYEWNEMALEEIVDAFQYVVKLSLEKSEKIKGLEDEIHYLNNLLDEEVRKKEMSRLELGVMGSENKYLKNRLNCIEEALNQIEGDYFE